MSKKLRCFAEKKNGYWIAVCLDLTLATQAGTKNDAIDSLLSQIESYVKDCSDGGIDENHQRRLMSRSAPIGMWLHYYYLRLRTVIDGLINKAPENELFNRPVPEVSAC